MSNNERSSMMRKLLKKVIPHSRASSPSRNPDAEGSRLAILNSASVTVSSLGLTSRATTPGDYFSYLRFDECFKLSQVSTVQRTGSPMPAPSLVVTDHTGE